MTSAVLGTNRLKSFRISKNQIVGSKMQVNITIESGNAKKKKKVNTVGYCIVSLTSMGPKIGMQVS